MSRLLWQNPVLLRELDERVRTRRTPIMLTIWLALLSGIVVLAYFSHASSSGQAFEFGGDVFGLARAGQSIFDWLLFFMLLLVLFLVPGFTAASIAGERERQTLLPMQVTLLRPIDIVVGKVAASVALTLLMIVATTPILVFVWLVGGVTIGEVFASLALIAFSALVLACVTVACSALVRRVPGAIVTAYGVVLVMVVGSLIVWSVLGVIDSSRGWDEVDPPRIVLATNPFFGVADVSDNQRDDSMGWYGPDTPMAAAREALDMSRNFVNSEFPAADPRGIAMAEMAAAEAEMAAQAALEEVMIAAGQAAVTLDDPVPGAAASTPPVPVDENGNPIVPEPVPAPILPLEEDGNPIVPDPVPAPIPLDENGNPIVPETIPAPILPLDENGNPIVPETIPAPILPLDENGNPIVPEPVPTPIPLPMPVDVPNFEIQRSAGIPFWIQYMFVSTLLAVAGLITATRRVRTPAAVER